MSALHYLLFAANVVRVSSTGGALNRSAAAGVSLKDLERGTVVLVGVVVAVGLALWGW